MKNHNSTQSAWKKYQRDMESALFGDRDEPESDQTACAQKKPPRQPGGAHAATTETATAHAAEEEFDLSVATVAQAERPR